MLVGSPMSQRDTNESEGHQRVTGTPTSHMDINESQGDQSSRHSCPDHQYKHLCLLKGFISTASLSLMQEALAEEMIARFSLNKVGLHCFFSLGLYRKPLVGAKT